MKSRLSSKHTSMWIFAFLILAGVVAVGILMVFKSSNLAMATKEAFINGDYFNTMQTQTNTIATGQCLAEGQYISSPNGVWQIGMSKAGEVVTMKNNELRKSIPILGARPHTLCLENGRLQAKNANGAVKWYYALSNPFASLKVTNDQKIKTYDQNNTETSSIHASTFAVL